MCELAESIPVQIPLVSKNTSSRAEVSRIQVELDKQNV